jgi:hypothetical protein
MLVLTFVVAALAETLGILLAHYVAWFGWDTAVPAAFPLMGAVLGLGFAESRRRT